MMAWPSRALVVPVAAAAVAALAQAPATGLSPDVRDVLTRQLRFSNAELADLQRGRIVKHGIETSVPGEIAVVGAVRVNAPKALFLERVRDIVRFKRDPNVLQIGRFSATPSLEDIAALTISDDDFDVRECRVGDCSVRLSADLIRRLEHEIDTHAPDAQARGAAWFKQVLLDDVTAYLSGGEGRILQYDDGPRPIRPVDEFEGILRNAPSIGALIPNLPDHLKNYPSNHVADPEEDFLYWSKEKFGASPFITVTHVTIACASPETCVMTTKDVYSSRYLDASLGLSIATDVAGAPNAFYLVYGNRFRANALKGGWSALRRSIVERRARGGLEESLKTIKNQLETRR
ncbi:MAG: hypothetical protein HY048_06660 [Acidobacteria bacterium]|nr:hypothetical protein [Acidobacteriota bacterium]